MRALLCNAPAVEHHDPVGVSHRGEPVGDHEHGARPPVLAAREALERGLDPRLVLGVGEGRGLVEHHDGGVLQYGAGNHEALHLAAREVRAIRTHDRVYPLRQLRQNVVALRRGQRASTSSRLASGRAARTLSRTLCLKSLLAWNTNATRSMRSCGSMSRTSTPPTSTRPSRRPRSEARGSRPWSCRRRSAPQAPPWSPPARRRSRSKAPAGPPRRR